MKIFIKKLISIAIAVLAVASFGAYAQQTVTIATRANPQIDAQLKQIIDAVNASTTDYRIAHTPISGDFQAHIKSGGAGADIYWVNQEDMSLALQDHYQSLNMCMAHKPRYTVGDMSDYYSQIIETGVINQIMYGLPIVASPVVAYINADLFTKAGLSLPTRYWTWDDLKDASQALTKDTNGDGRIDQWGFVADGWPPPQMFIWQAGGDIVGGGLGSSPIDSAPSVAALDFYRSFSPAGQQLSRNVSVEQLFREGKVGIFFGSSTENFAGQGNVVMQQVPRNPITHKHTTFAWTELLAMSKNSNNPAACEAIQAVGDRIQQTMGASPRTSHGTAQKYAALNPSKSGDTETVLNSMQQMRSPRIFASQASFDNVFWSNLITPLVSGETNLTTAQLVAQVKPLLESNLR